MSASDPRENIKPACPLFAEAFLNIPHRVFGLRMRPYCLWHSFLLHYHLSPVVFSELGRPTLADVMLAARIGACRYGEWPEPLPRWSLTRLRMAWISRRANAAKEALRLRDWIADYASGPDFWTEQKTATADGAGFKERGDMPSQLNTASRLMLMGFSERDAWEQPVGKARWYAAGYAALNGAELDFVEPLAPALEKRIREARAKYEADKKAKAEAAAKNPKPRTDAGAKKVKRRR